MKALEFLVAGVFGAICGAPMVLFLIVLSRDAFGRPEKDHAAVGLAAAALLATGWLPALVHLARSTFSPDLVFWVCAATSPVALYALLIWKERADARRSAASSSQ